MAYVSQHLLAQPSDNSDHDVCLLQALATAPEAAVDTALRAVIDRFQNGLMGYLYNQCWDQSLAEELAHVVFIKLYQNRSSYRAHGSARSYVYRIARNCWIDYLRSQKRHQAQPLQDVEEAHSPCGGSDKAEREHTRFRIQEAVRSLPDNHRQVFLLANNQGLQYDEIAAVLDIPEGTVKSRMYYAVRKLRSLLGDLA